MLKITVDYPDAFNAPRSRRSVDFSAMSSSPVNAVRITLPWAWLEPEENRFVLTELNRILSDADKNGLTAVIAFSPELPPVWLTARQQPPEPICLDNPLIFKVYSSYISRVISSCTQSGASVTWDIGTLSYEKCFCTHTLALFRKWLESEYKKLSDLNKRWHTAYTNWNAICPSANKSMSVPEQMEFERFSSWRARRIISELFRHAKKHSKNSEIIASASCAGPSGAADIVMDKDESGNLASGWIDNVTLNLPTNKSRSSFFASSSESVSMLGADSFQAAEYILNDLEAIKTTRSLQPSNELDLSPYDFFFKTLSLCAKGIRLASWVPFEHPGKYSACASSLFSEQDFESDSERFDKLWECASVYEQNESFFENWVPDEPLAAIFLSRQSGNIHRLNSNDNLHMRSLRGWSKAFAGHSIPFRIIDENSINELKHIRLLVLPRVTALDDSAAEKILDFAEQGGTLFGEAETGAWDTLGFPRDRLHRMFAEASGIFEYQRRSAPKDKFKFKFQNDSFILSPGSWITPMRAIRGVTENIIPFDSDKSLMLNFLYGSGTVILCGGFPGEASAESDSRSLSRFAAQLAKSASIPSRFSIQPKKNADDFHICCGESMGRRAVFVFMPPKTERTEIVFDKGFWPRRVLRELVSGSNVELAPGPHGQQKLRIKNNHMHVSVFSE